MYWCNPGIAVAFASGIISGTVLLYHLHKKWNIAKKKYYFLNVDGIKCQLCFNERTPNLCGNETCSFSLTRRIVKHIDEAQKFVYFCNPIICIPDIIQALIRAHERRVLVQIIVDSSISGPPEIIHYLKAGIGVRSIGNENMMMHNKFIIVDGELMVRGSLNYTASVKGNCENVQFFHDKKRIAIYQKHFMELWDENSLIHKC